MRWVRNAVLNNSRRREELKQRVLDEASRLAKSPEASFFLAQGQISNASGIFEANEMLHLLDVLRPVYERQPGYLQAKKQWTEQRVTYLQQIGQLDEALRLRRELAEQYPRDAELQRSYAYALSRSGEYRAAYAWLDRVIVPAARWLPQEDFNLRSTYTNLLEQQSRYNDMVGYLADWIKLNPEWQTAYAQYLSALVKTDRADEANRLIRKWLEEGRQAGPLPQPVASRLNAALNQALGQGHNLYTNRLEEQWLEPLRETVKFFAVHPSNSHATGNIMGNWRFQQTDACRAARTKMLQILRDDLDTLPANTVQSLVNRILPNDPAIEVQQWRQLANRLTKRWANESDPDVKHQLAAPAVQIMSRFLTADEHIAFLRRQLEDAPAKYRGMYANQLFDALLNQPWSSEYEDELFALLPQQSSALGGGESLRDHVVALHRLTDRMLQARYDARMANIEHAEDLTRTELREKQQEAQRLAREGYAARLDQAVPQLPAELAPWLRAERLYVDMLLGRHLNKVAEQCWEVIGTKPATIEATDDQFADLLQAVLRHRHLTMLTNLAARRGADAALVDRLLAYLDAGIAGADSDAEQFAWRIFKYRLLIALDRPKLLEQVLRAWIRPEEADNYWRRALGYLMAEQGRIKESIELFERIEADDELSPDDYRVLAGWHMAADARDKHERALIESFKAMEEWRLGNWLNRKLQPWRRHEGALPSELDKDVLRVFAALFEKSAHPQNYTWQLEQFYRASRDFRLLAGLADAVVGHTAGQVYPFLGSMRSTLNEVRDEATADSMVEHLAKVRSRAKSTVDHRALDLLELLVERRSSEVINQPGPHVERALVAMQRAFKREWSDGEPRLMADFLAGFGQISQKPLADEQVRQLEVLHDEAEKGTTDRLHIAYAVAQAYWSYNRYAEAIDLLTAALSERRAACDGVLPTTANGPLGTLISYLESRAHHARGEQLLFEELEHPANRQQTFWLTQRLYQLYESAISREGDVSLGRGAMLYRAVEQKIQDEMKTDDHNHRYNLVSRLCGIYRTARDKKIAGVADDLRAFAFDRLPEVLGRQTNNYQSIVSTVAQTLRDLASPRDGLELLIVQIEREPQWFRLNNQDGWSQHSYQLARWRNEVGDKLGDLEPRLLKIVIGELKQDLQTQQSRNRNMYHRNHGSHYWSEKTNNFVQAAEEVYAQRKDSGAAVKYIADYLFEGVARKDRAIEILLCAHQKDKILDEAGQAQLVRYLQWQNRHGESIPILEPLVERRPNKIQYRLQLMHAYYRTGQQAKLLAQLKQTDEYFHQDGRWQEDAISSLAYGCLENHLFEQSVAYYEEVISLHQRMQPRRGIGNETLSGYYGNLSKAYAGLRKTVEAVDAACGAIVSWGPRQDRRDDVLRVLKSVLRDAPDLDDYVAHLDKQSAEEGVDNPVVRKALGKVYFDKQQYKQAIVQLKLARELQPNDQETHENLVTCYDKLGDKQGAVDQLLESLRLSRRNISLYQDLGRRYDELEQPVSAERARTSIVEALPNESEGHAMLAEIRQQQNRWSDAIGHWRQVAEIRSLEPTGLLKLATAQVHQKQWAAATAACGKLRARTWPERFRDVDRQIRELERKIDDGRPK
jgi:predicted Zn-dependent protease